MNFSYIFNYTTLETNYILIMIYNLLLTFLLWDVGKIIVTKVFALFKVGRKAYKE